MGYLKFNLIQNWDKEFPELEPYMVIELQKDSIEKGFSSCDEYGISDFIPTGETMLFLPANEETNLAFIGERIESRNKTFFLVKEKKGE